MLAITRKLPELAYTPLGLTHFKAATEAEARKEYTRLRDIAQKRLKRLRESRYANRPEVKNFYPNGVPTLKELGKDLHALERGVARLYQWLSGPTTVTEQKRGLDARILKTLHENRFYVAENDLAPFGCFMDYVSSRLQGMFVPSEVVAEYFVEARQKGLNGDRLRRDFEAFLKREYNIEFNEDKAFSWSQIRRVVKNE